VFLASAANGVPLALTQFIRHNHVMHERIILLTVVIEETPRITDEDRVVVIEVIKGITRVILHVGFMDSNITIAAGRLRSRNNMRHRSRKDHLLCRPRDDYPE
jgi:KUP system potassium uptake protein